MTENRNFAFDALVKEAEFVRNELLLCIETIRKLAVYATYIAGFALPVVASLISAGRGELIIDSPAAFFALLKDNLIIIQFVCLGVSLSSVAFLRIYVGSFLQIHNFARYFREHLIPSIEKVAGNPDVKLFHWEVWLQNQRRKRALFVGDSELAAEPILIGLYALVYGAAFVALGVFGQSFPISSMVLGAVVLLVVTMSYLKFVSVLRASTK